MGHQAKCVQLGGSQPQEPHTCSGLLSALPQVETEPQSSSDCPQGPSASIAKCSFSPASLTTIPRDSLLCGKCRGEGELGPAPSGHWLRWGPHRPSPAAQHMEECYDMTFCRGIVSCPGARLSQSLCGQVTALHIYLVAWATPVRPPLVIQSYLHSVSLESCRGLRDYQDRIQEN